MRRLTAVLMAGIMVLTTLAGSLTAFADTEIDQTAPVIHAMELLNGDDYDARPNDKTGWTRLKVKMDLTEEGSGVTWIALYFDSFLKSFRYDAEHYRDEPGYGGDVPLYSGVHTIELNPQNDFAVGEYPLVEIVIGDANGNRQSIYGDELKAFFGEIPVLKVIKSNYIEKNFELEHFKFLDTENINGNESIAAEIKFKSNFEVRRVSLSFYDLATGKEEKRNLEISYPKGKGLKSGTHKIKFDLKNQYTKGTKVLYYLDVENEFGRFVEDSPGIFGNDRIHITDGKEPVKDPEIIDFQFRNNQITAPDVIRIDLDIKANGNELNRITLGYKDKNGKTHNLEGDLKMQSEGKYYAEVPVHPFITEGQLKMFVISVEDYIASEDMSNCHDSIWDSENAQLVAKGDININSGYNITYFSSVGNKNVPSALKEMKAGETAVLDCRNYKIASKELFENMAGRDITVAFVDNNVQWVFNGKNIEKSKCKRINLNSRIEVVSGETAGFPDDQKVAKLVFRDNGELPGEVEMRINYDYLAAKYKFNKENLKLTYLAPTNPVLEDANVDAAKDNYYEYEVDHNSTFVLSKTKAKLGTTTVTMVPNNLKAVKIKWKKTKGNGYYVYRATKKDGKYEKVATIKGNKNISFEDRDVIQGKNYYYKVKPYSTKKSFNKTAKMSKSCKAYTKLKAPRLCGIMYSKYRKGVTIEWVYNSAATKYELYRATKAEGPYKKIMTTSKIFVTDKNAKKGKNYYYKVKAIYKTGSKLNSDLGKAKGRTDM